MLLKEFKDLRRKRDKLLGLPDQLNYAIPIDDYTIALKDGAFLSAFECSGSGPQLSQRRGTRRTSCAGQSRTRASG